MAGTTPSAPFPHEVVRSAFYTVANYFDALRKAWIKGDAEQLRLLAAGFGSETSGYADLMRHKVRADAANLREKLRDDADFLPLVLRYCDPSLRDSIQRMIRLTDLDARHPDADGEVSEGWQQSWPARNLDGDMDELLPKLRAAGDAMMLRTAPQIDPELLARAMNAQTLSGPQDRAKRLHFALEHLALQSKRLTAWELVADTRDKMPPRWGDTRELLAAIDAARATVAIGPLHSRGDQATPKEFERFLCGWLETIQDELATAGDLIAWEGEHLLGADDAEHLGIALRELRRGLDTFVIALTPGEWDVRAAIASIRGLTATLQEAADRVAVRLAAAGRRKPETEPGQRKLTSGGAADPQAGGSQAGEGKGFRKPSGWTRKELIDEVKQTLPDWGASTFDRIRIQAGVKPGEKGGRGAQRRFSKAELRKLINAVAGGSFHDKVEIAAAWRDLLTD